MDRSQTVTHSAFVLLFSLGSLGIWEILLIGLVVVLLFGAKKLPEIGTGLGKGIRGFKQSLKGEDEDSNREIDDGK